MEHFGDAISAPGSAPTDVNIKTNAGDVALDIVQGFVIGAVVMSAQETGSGIAAVFFRTAVYVAVELIASGAVYGCVGGTNVVQVCTAATGIAAAKRLGPNVLSVPTVPLAHIGNIAGIQQNHSAVFILAIGLGSHSFAIVVGAGFLVGVGH